MDTTKQIAGWTNFGFHNENKQRFWKAGAETIKQHMKKCARGITTDLNKIIEYAKSFGILTALNIHQWPNLWSSEGDMLIPHNNFKLLTSNTIRFRPAAIIFLHDLKQDISKHKTINLMNEKPTTHPWHIQNSTSYTTWQGRSPWNPQHKYT